MKIFSVILLFTGLVFLLVAYKIYFKKSYNLINGFEKDFKKGIKDENYPIKIGKIYFIIGFILIIVGLLLIYLNFKN